MYVDFQMFFYLADPQAVLVSNERLFGRNGEVSAEKPHHLLRAVSSLLT
jgi:hypothetical protein